MYVDIFNTDQRYDLIVTDPPWKQAKGGKKSVRENSSGRPLDYPVCSLEEIKEHLRAADALTSDNAVLFLWTIDKYLFEAEEIRDVVSMVVPHAERPRFPDPLLIRTRCPDTYSKIVWMKAQHEGALTPPCIVRKRPQVTHTAQQVPVTQ